MREEPQGFDDARDLHLEDMAHLQRMDMMPPAPQAPPCPGCTWFALCNLREKVYR